MGDSEEMTDEEIERVERKLHLIMNLASLALSAYVIWDFVKDKPEVMVLRQKVGDFFRVNFVAPVNARRNLKKQEAQVVFEAMQAVTDD